MRAELKKRERAAFSLKIVGLKRKRGSGAKQIQWNVGSYSVPPFQDKMCSVPPWKKFFWPGLKILRPGGLASSAGSLFQCFTSLTDKKVFLVCNSLHGWNRQPETAWEDGFSNTSWAFVQTGFEIWEIRNGWITQSELISSCPVPLLCTPKVYISFMICLTDPTQNMSEHLGSELLPAFILSPCHLQHVPYEEYTTKASAHWHGPQGII